MIHSHQIPLPECDGPRAAAAANIAVALYYLQREAQATGLTQLAGLIDRAVREASSSADHAKTPIS
jgi:hypothetical protein